MTTRTTPAAEPPGAPRPRRAGTSPAGPNPSSPGGPSGPRVPLGRRTWLAIITVGFVGQLAWTIENMYLNVFVYNAITTDPTVIATMVACSAAAATLATIVVGAWSDRLGKRRAFISIGYIVWGLCTAAFGFLGLPDSTVSAAAPVVLTAIIAVIALDCVMSVFGSGANDAAFNAWVTDSTHVTNRGRVEGWLATLPLMSMLVVFALLDGLTRAGEWTLFFGIIGAVTTLTGIASWFLVRDREVPPTRTTVWAGIVHWLRPSTMRAHPALYLTLLTYAVLSISVQTFLPYVIIYLQHYLQIEAYAIALGITLLLAAVLSVIAGRIMDRVGKTRFLLPAVAVFAMGLVAMFFARDLIAVIASATVMMGGMMASLATVAAMTRDHTPAAHAGSIQGVRMILVVMVPMIIGPFIGAAAITGANNTFTELGVTKSVPGPEIFLAAAAVLLLVPITAFLRSRKVRS
ncbi:MFS family permease [Leucobacter exalbidus]|uniref:MFS family permease n=1 Tax=Leucobacter exalbidus TaxID=662960 RepID=A0A940PTB6_9MICO|nr:MFS transporter [Leucobacter exalbidus]MBP1324861.1 MFS family permease [Leucobacter exalbidus]